MEGGDGDPPAAETTPVEAPGTQPLTPTQPSSAPEPTTGTEADVPKKTPTKRKKTSKFSEPDSDLVDKWVDRVDNILLARLDLEGAYELGQTRYIDDEHVQKIVNASNNKKPLDLVRLVAWEKEDRTLIALTNQHYCSAMNIIANDRRKHNRPVETWMEWGTATILKTNTPLSIRELISGRDNAVQGIQRVTTTGELARLYLREHERDPSQSEGNWEVKFILALEKSGRLLAEMEESRANQKLKRQKDDDEVVCSFLSFCFPHRAENIAAVFRIVRKCDTHVSFPTLTSHHRRRQ